MRSILRQQDQPRLLHRLPSQRQSMQASSYFPLDNVLDVSYLDSSLPNSRECDFYTNPTILSRLILHQKYEAAMRRSSTHSEEARTWVVVRRQTSPASSVSNQAATPSSPAKTTSQRSNVTSLSSLSEDDVNNTTLSSNRNGDVDCEYYSCRQLPIHMACGNLFRVVDPALKAQLEKLIATLVVAFPEACSQRDHQHRMPLHEAIWYRAGPETISALLIAYPDAVSMRDKYGRYPMALNECRDSPYRTQIRHMLLQGRDFWNTARTEAKLRLKHRTVPADLQSVASQSVLAASVTSTDDNSMYTRGDSVRQGRAGPGYQQLSPTITGCGEYKLTITSWSQLEHRTNTLEEKLAESMQENYETGKEATKLRVSKAKFQAKYDVLMGTGLGKQIELLQNEKIALEVQVRDLQQLAPLAEVRSFPLNQDHPMDKLVPQNIVLHCQPEVTVDVELQVLREENVRLKAGMGLLSQKHKDYQRRLDFAESLLDDMEDPEDFPFFDDNATDYSTIFTISTGTPKEKRIHTPRRPEPEKRVLSPALQQVRPKSAMKNFMPVEDVSQNKPSFMDPLDPSLLEMSREDDLESILKGAQEYFDKSSGLTRRLADSMSLPTSRMTSQITLPSILEKPDGQSSRDSRSGSFNSGQFSTEEKESALDDEIIESSLHTAIADSDNLTVLLQETARLYSALPRDASIPPSLSPNVSDVTLQLARMELEHGSVNFEDLLAEAAQIYSGSSNVSHF